LATSITDRERMAVQPPRLERFVRTLEPELEAIEPLGHVSWP